MYAEKLPFKENYNGKLHNAFFTTIRSWNAVKYAPGTWFEVGLKSYTLGIATVVKATQFDIDKLPEISAYMDTGYDAATTRAMLEEFYPGYRGAFGIILMAWRERYYAFAPGSAEAQPGTQGEEIPAPAGVGVTQTPWQYITHIMRAENDYNPRRAAEIVAGHLYQDRLHRDKNSHDETHTLHLVWMDVALINQEWGSMDHYSDVYKGMQDARKASTKREPLTHQPAQTKLPLIQV